MIFIVISKQIKSLSTNLQLKTNTSNS